MYKQSVLTRLTLPQVSSVSESHIQAYEVCVSYRNTERSVCMNVTLTQVELTREINMSDMTVRAVIQSGLSEPAHITIPAAYTGDKAPTQHYSVFFCALFMLFCITSDDLLLLLMQAAC